MGLSSLLFQSHEIPIWLQFVAAHCNTSPQFLSPEMEGYINQILAYEIVQLFYLHQELSLFSSIQSTSE